MRIELDEQALRSTIQDGMDRMAQDMDREMEALCYRCAGRPVEEVKPELQRLYARFDWNIVDPMLSEHAQLISDGTRIKFRVGEVQM